MPCDVLILNTAVLDLRSAEFGFADRLVGRGGLAKCATRDMPPFSQEQISGWIAQGRATAGGPGNSAPLMARAGLSVAVGAYLGSGAFGGFDAQGRAFHDLLASCGVDVSWLLPHPALPTGTTFIHEAPGAERGGIAYFPNANDDFDFDRFRDCVKRRQPRIVYYMYSGLSERGDANGGRDLAAFMRWCRAQGCLTIADSHTLTANPADLIRKRSPVPAYRLLEPLLPELDLFFTSADEARLMAITFGEAADMAHGDFLGFLARRFPGKGRERLLGCTHARGAVALRVSAGGTIGEPVCAESRFLAGEVVDLVGAGDSFRAGLLCYVARHENQFLAGAADAGEALQTGNLFASLFIKAPLRQRYGYVRDYSRLQAAVRSGRSYQSMESLLAAL